MFKVIWMWIIDNRDFLIALVALFLTILQFIISCVKNQEKYEIIVNKVDLSSNGNNNTLLLSMSIFNCSSSPLNITKIHLINEKSKVLCKLNKTWSGEHYYPKFPETDIPRTERIFSAQFPISIQPNGAMSVLVRFDSAENFIIPDNCLKLEVSTIKNIHKISIKYLQ